MIKATEIQLTTLVIGSIYYWKAFEYEYKWPYPPKTISEPTHWLHVNYYRPKVKPCQDEQTLVKGAYKNQLNRVPTKVTDTNLTYRQTHVSIQWNLNAYPYPTRQVSKSWHTLDGSFNIDWRGLVIFDLPSVLKFKKTWVQFLHQTQALGENLILCSTAAPDICSGGHKCIFEKKIELGSPTCY